MWREISGSCIRSEVNSLAWQIVFCWTQRKLSRSIFAILYGALKNNLWSHFNSFGPLSIPMRTIDQALINTRSSVFGFCIDRSLLLDDIFTSAVRVEHLVHFVQVFSHWTKPTVQQHLIEHGCYSSVRHNSAIWNLLRITTYDAFSELESLPLKRW